MQEGPGRGAAGGRAVVGRAARAPSRRATAAAPRQVRARVRAVRRAAALPRRQDQGHVGHAKGREAPRATEAAAVLGLRVPLRRAAAHTLPARRAARGLVLPAHGRRAAQGGARARKRRWRVLHHANLLRAVAMPADPVGRLCRRWWRSGGWRRSERSERSGRRRVGRRQCVGWRRWRRRRRRRRRRRWQPGPAAACDSAAAGVDGHGAAARLPQADLRAADRGARATGVPRVADAQPQLPLRRVRVRHGGAAARAAELARRGAQPPRLRLHRRAQGALRDRRGHPRQELAARRRLPLGLRRAVPARADGHLPGAPPTALFADFSRKGFLDGGTPTVFCDQEEALACVR